ncbi:unnamed protein product, partial [Ectocarpus sp. 4 AP-2014]
MHLAEPSFPALCRMPSPALSPACYQSAIRVPQHRQPHVRGSRGERCEKRRHILRWHILRT